MMLALAVVLLAGAAFRLVHFMRERGHSDELAYFYDLSERKLFVAPRTLVPPIRGINNDEPDGMRAIVISTSGDSKDKTGQKIAYLEKYAPELKEQFEAIQSGQESRAPSGSRISRGAAQSFIFVRRLNEATWYPVNTMEGEKIMTEWQVPGPDGKTPIVSVP